MSANGKQPPAHLAAQQGQQQQFPPPPGPPPAQTTQAQPPKHTNETPLPDYDIPGYNPAHPQFAPPPGAGDDDIYNSSPTNEHAPKWGFHHGHGQGHSPQTSDGEGKKKANRLSAFGEAFASKVAGPVNALANKFGSEGFLPEPLDKECEKAARILRGFCKDGIYNDSIPGTAAPAVVEPPPTTDKDKPPSSPSAKAASKKNRTLLTIPSKVIARAQGLAIFTAVRLGFQATGSSGSGVLLARLPDGNWSPPVAIQVTSIGAGFVAGVDIFDCVIVINTREALELFTKTRISLGSDLAVTAGPFGAGGALDWGMRPSEKEGKRPGSSGEKGKEPLLPPPAAASASATHPTNPTITTTSPPLSKDNTHFQTPPVPESQQGMGRPEDERDHHHHDHKRTSSKDKNKIDRRPSPFREAMKKPVYSYVKSRGFYAGIQIDGTVIAARETATAKFYGQAIPVERILAGEVPAQGPQGMWPGAPKVLFDVLKGAEGWRAQQPPQQQPLQARTPGGNFGAVSPGLGPQPTPAFGKADGTGGAPHDAWVAPPSGGAPPGAGPVPGQGVAGVTAGMQNLGVGGAAPGPSTGGIPPPPPGPPTTGAAAKAAEAAADAARAEPAGPPPPSYSEPTGAEDLPPAYVEDERYRGVSGDSKTGQH